MNDILNSPAFQEFLQKRCEEIITNDKVYCQINDQILQAEKEIMPLLSNDAMKQYLKIDRIRMELLNFVLSYPNR